LTEARGPEQTLELPIYSFEEEQKAMEAFLRDPDRRPAEPRRLASARVPVPKAWSVSKEGGGYPGASIARVVHPGRRPDVDWEEDPERCDLVVAAYTVGALATSASESLDPARPVSVREVSKKASIWLGLPRPADRSPPSSLRVFAHGDGERTPMGGREPHPFRYLVFTSPSESSVEDVTRYAAVGAATLKEPDGSRYLGIVAQGGADGRGCRAREGSALQRETARVIARLVGGLEVRLRASSAGRR
jgi:hypothetical protein